MPPHGFDWMSSPPPPSTPPEGYDSSASDSLTSSFAQMVFLIILLGCQHPALVIEPCVLLYVRLRQAVMSLYRFLMDVIDGRAPHERLRGHPTAASIARAARRPGAGFTQLESPPTRIVLHPRLARLQARLDSAVRVGSGGESGPPLCASSAAADESVERDDSSGGAEPAPGARRTADELHVML